MAPWEIVLDLVCAATVVVSLWHWRDEARRCRVLTDANAKLAERVSVAEIACLRALGEDVMGDIYVPRLTRYFVNMAEYNKASAYLFKLKDKTSKEPSGAA